LPHRDVLDYLTAACAVKIRGAAALAPARANRLNGYLSDFLICLNNVGQSAGMSPMRSLYDETLMALARSGVLC
jgi:hypothetical protein